MILPYNLMNWIDMKTQQRKFVVERKVGRRRLTVQPTSIWGDTDLKAIVRKAEADAPHLFEPTMVSDTAGHDREPQTDTASKTHLNDKTGSGEQKLIVALPVKAEQSPPYQQGDDLTLNAAAPLKLDTHPQRPPRMAKRRRVGQAEGASIAPTARSTAAEVEAAADELVALEAENRRLKGLLAQHFREQNTQLRKMLARFNVS